MSEPLSARDLLDPVKVVVDTVVPTLLFAVLSIVATLGTAAVVALGWSVLAVLVRLLRRQPPTYALGGLGGVAAGVALAVATDDAETYFLPGIAGNIAVAALFTLSVLLRRPAIAYTSAALYRWPMGWYLHDRVRPAYSEITWLWALYYALKGALQLWLVARDDMALLATVRIVSGWPMLIGLLAVTYAYVTWRLERLDGPDVESWRAQQSEPAGG